MRKQRYTPYLFDIKYEIRTYKHIGKDYGDHKTADKGWIRNFFRWYRKRLYNRKESKYKFCNTFEEWRQYLCERKFCNIYDKQNLIKFLCKQKRTCEIMLEFIKSQVIPIYIALFSVVIGLAFNIIEKLSTGVEVAELESKVFLPLVLVRKWVGNPFKSILLPS